MTPQQLKRLFPNASPSLLAANCKEAPGLAVLPNAITPKVNILPRDTTDEHKLNPTERKYLNYLESVNYPWLGIQNITLKLAHDCRYTPDFWTLETDGSLVAREVKGYFREDAKIKIKTAARLFPWIKFILAFDEKGSWRHELVKP